MHEMNRGVGTHRNLFPARKPMAVFVAAIAVVLAQLVTDESNAHGDAPSRRPNVILILADDLGWTDLRCYGSDLHDTPRLDRLAAEGVRFTQNYSACTVCSPTRAALLTGKYPARLHITDWIPGLMPDNPKLLVPDWTKHLPAEEVTLGSLFKSAGYRTATIGKWHLGGPEHYPDRHGFDVNIAGTDKAAPPSFIAPWGIPNLPEGKPGEYLTDRLGEEAAQFVRDSRDQPFFLYLPHFAVHTPIQGREDLVKKYRARDRSKLRHRNAHYAAMTESLDAAVGRVLDAVDQCGLTDNTVVIFTSDNGGRITKQTTTNAPLRYGKASAYEGGVRVPLIIRWPGKARTGSVCTTPVVTMDLFPTLVEIAALAPPQSTSPTGPPGRDGISLVPLLLGTAPTSRQELFWHYPHHQHYQLGGTMPYGAIRSGDFKLIEFYDEMRVELYDLKNDVGEQNDLAAAQPDRAIALRARLHAWRSEVGAQMPTPNPAYDPAQPQAARPQAAQPQ